VNYNERIRQRCDWLLASLVGADLVEDWWQSPNRHWSGQRPQDVFETHPQDVLDYLMYYALK
jgi:hypothetical protein